MSNDNREARIIQERRKQLMRTQADIAVEVGISLQQYQRFEYGQRRLSATNMRLGLRICAALELNPYEVVFRDEVDFANPYDIGPVWEVNNRNIL